MRLCMDGWDLTFLARSHPGSSTQWWPEGPRKVAQWEQVSVHRNWALGSSGLGSNIVDEPLARPILGPQKESPQRCKAGALL